MFRKVLFQIHWFIGITAGIVLAIVGFTGGMLAFEQEILRQINSSLMSFAAGDGSALTPVDLIERIQAQSPDKSIASLTLFSSQEEAARVGFAAKPPARRGESRYVSPYSGEILPKLRGEDFFRTVTQIHRYLASGEVGKQIVGASTLGLVFIAFSGLYLRWPRKVFDWQVWLTLKWSQRGRAFLWSLHSVMGTWVLLCYLLAALTGLYWSYNWYRDALFSLTGAPRPIQAPSAAGLERPREATVSHAKPVVEQSRDMDRAWDLFQRTVRGYSSATLRLPAKASQPVQITYLDPDPPHSRAINRIVFDVAAGEHIEHERYQEKPAGGKIMSSMFSLHSGRFFGLPGAVLMMLASFLMPLSAVSGWLLYVDRRRTRKSNLASSFSLGDVRYGK